MAILNWEDAPEWATHIVHDVDFPHIQCWARKVGGDYFNESFRECLTASFHMFDDFDGEPGSWMVLSERPTPEKEVA